MTDNNIFLLQEDRDNLDYSVVQSQEAVSAYKTSSQVLLFDFAEKYYEIR